MRFKPVLAASVLALSTSAALPALAQAGPQDGAMGGTLSAEDPTEADGRHFDDHDVTLDAGTRYRIGAESEAFDVMIRLYGPAGGPALIEDDDGGDALNSRITFTPGESGTYRLRVTTYDSTGLGDYSASVEALPPLPAPVTRSTGTETMTWKVFQGELTADDPEDEGRFDDYQVTLTAGQPTWIHLTATDGAFDTMLKLYTLDQRDGEPVATDDDSGGDLNSLLIFTPETSGDYIVRVTSFEAGNTGAYTLRVGN